MVVVMAAMMSTATYAWFTLTSDATVTGMQMTAGGSSGLKVSTDNANWFDAVSLEQLDPETGDPIKQVVNQITVKDGDKVNGNFVAKFYKPNYSDTDVVDGVTLITDDITNYVAKYTYYLKSEAATELVALRTAARPSASDVTGIEDGQPLYDGSFVRAIDGSDTSSAVNAVRVGIVIGEGNNAPMYIYEPNANGTVTGTAKATDSTGNTYVANVRSDVEGNITDSAEFVSDGLFTVTNAGVKVTMYVWLEGTDPQCVNDIQADEIEAQIQFTTVTAP